MKKNIIIFLLLSITNSSLVKSKNWIGYEKAYHPRTEGIQGPITIKSITKYIPNNPIIIFSGNEEDNLSLSAALNQIKIKNYKPEDLILQNITLKKIDLLWLDTNGSELQNLFNLEALLDSVNYIYIKVYLIEKDQDCPLYQSIRKFLENKGFRAIKEDLPWDNAGYVLFEQKHNPTPYASQPAVQQDKILNETIFKNMKNGFFVDIGAHDGVSHSNTYFFEKHLNWNGICFEPLSNAYRQLIKTRNCTCINACVSQTEGEVEFIEVSGAPEMLSGMVHTYDPRHLARMKLEIKRDGGSYTVTKIPSINFNQTMNDYNIKTIDFISIDTEGAELEILQSIDFKQFNIHAITVENNFNDPAIKKYMKSQGFKYLPLFSGQDEVYINPQFKG